MARRKYYGTCVRCGQAKIYRATDPKLRSALGDPMRAWFRCDGCGLAYQTAPNPPPRRGGRR